MIKSRSFKIIIPAFEPNERLIVLLRNLGSEGLVEDVIIVNDGSNEEYDYIFQEATESYGVTILRHAVNLGKGRALKDAFNYVLNEFPNCVGVITADSDGQHSVEDIKKIAYTLIENPKSLILGCRSFNKDGVPWKSKFGNNITKASFRFLCSLKISDTQTGLRGIPIEFTKKLLSTPGERFEYETNMLLESKNIVNIVEVPIQTIYDSKENHITHFDPLRDSLMIYKIILTYSLASVFSTVIDFIIFAIFNGLGASVYISTAMARCISAILNFSLNRNIVFKSRGNPYAQLLKYIMLVVFSGFISATLIIKLSIAIPINVIGIKAIVETCLFFFNYFIQRVFVFSKKEDAA